MRAPLAPMGWPRATAPPWTFIFSCGMLQFLHRRHRHHGKRLVDLEQVDVGDRQPELLQRRSIAHDGGQREPLRLAGEGGVAEDPGLRLHAQLLGLFGREHHDGGRAVVDARGVAGRDGAALREGRPQGPQLLLVEAARLLVLGRR